MQRSSQMTYFPIVMSGGWMARTDANQTNTDTISHWRVGQLMLNTNLLSASIVMNSVFVSWSICLIGMVLFTLTVISCKIHINIVCAADTPNRSPLGNYIQNSLNGVTRENLIASAGYRDNSNNSSHPFTNFRLLSGINGEKCVCCE
jgi:hypothetical protein